MLFTESRIETLAASDDFPSWLDVGMRKHDRRAARPSPMSPEMSYGRHAGPAPHTARCAAVAILLFRRDGRWHMPLTERPTTLARHGGQISLPGGVIEAGESSFAAVQRELREVKGESGAVSGGAMDRVVERKKIDKRIMIGAGVGALLFILLVFWLFAPRSGSQTVNPSRLTIVEAKQGTFEDFLPLRARVAPLVTVYLDAVEGGRVEQLAVEDGASVVKGQLLAVLSNADLQLSTLARQTEVEQQLNNMRSQELALQQTRSANRREMNQVQNDLSKAQRLYDLQRPLAEKGFVSAKTFLDLKWGTKEPVVFRDKELSMVRLRAFGKFAVRIKNPQAFVNQLVGTMGLEIKSGIAFLI